MYNLLEYSKKKIQKKTRPLGELLQGWTSNPLSFNSEYLKYKGRFTGNTYNLVAEDDGYDAEKVGKHEIEIVVPLNQWSNFWRTLNIPLINCAIELILTWSKNCALVNMIVRAAGNNNGPSAIVVPAGLEYQITDTILYVPVATLSRENNKTLLEQLKSGFKRTIKRNKYRLQMSIQSNNNNLNYLTDPTFTKVSRLFVLSFARIAVPNTTKDHRDSFLHYYVPNVEIKDFNVLIDGKSIFDFPIKNEEEDYKKIIEMSRNNDYTTGVFIGFCLFQRKLQINCIWLE